ncbi:MAG: TIGR03620 family F420-dependent LLM class oxidoreductase [Acidimicrobiales bacterium]
MDLGQFGIWWSGSWNARAVGLDDVASEMERLGYQTLWMSAGFDPGIRPLFKQLLEATQNATIATGILSVWPNQPATVAAEVEALGPRFLLGVGASHDLLVEAAGQKYERPLRHVAQFLDGLDEASPPVPAQRRILAALGPHMLSLGAERSLGAHPYFVPLEHTVRAREILGRDALLAPEVAVVLESDPGVARAAARSYTAGYLQLPNYANNLIALGWPVDDLQSSGSDRLVDALVPWGTPAQVAQRLREHLDAGADHVSIQVVRDHGADFPLEEYRQLAAQLF